MSSKVHSRLLKTADADAQTAEDKVLQLEREVNIIHAAAIVPLTPFYYYQCNTALYASL